ncbi:hypothetical protein [Miniphocaeibacter massiliensis]|uniref:hypothetical protein n=1 Tax=Miniphocaeibacter massiliensis TaxID=2041841 RepID=UPI0013EAF61F|nr:hypothetical protein [Miniphocaeibacter massiliensis]
MYSAMIATSEYLPDEENINSTAISTIVSLIIAEQIALMISIAAASSAVVASSSYNS